MPTTLTKNQFVDVNDLVTLTNDDDFPWEAMYESRTYHADPHRTINVPFYLVVKEFGDPRSSYKAQKPNIRGVIHYIPNRESEVARLCFQYGIHDNNVGDGLKAKAPHVTIRDQDGTQITTVLDDFKGTHALPATMDDISERDLLEARLAQIQAQLDALKDNKTPSNLDDVEDVSEDTPPDLSEPQTHRRRGA